MQPALGVGELHPVADDERPGHRLRCRRASGVSPAACPRAASATDGDGCDRCPRLRRAHSELSVGRPSLGPMTAMVQTDATAAAARGRAEAGERRRAAPSVAVAQPRGRLQDLPAALPLPHDRPAARAQEPRRGARHAGARRAGAAVRPARPPSAPSRPPRSCSPGAGRELREEPGVAELFAVAQDDGARPRRRRRSRSRPGWPRPGSWSRTTSRSRTRPASSRTAARSWSRSPCPTGCCCAASSTGSTSPRRRAAGRRLQDRRRCRARPSRPRRCSR